MMTFDNKYKERAYQLYKELKINDESSQKLGDIIMCASAMLHENQNLIHIDFDDRYEYEEEDNLERIKSDVLVGTGTYWECSKHECDSCPSRKYSDNCCDAKMYSLIDRTIKVMERDQ